jgi:hypothetical protein
MLGSFAIFGSKGMTRVPSIAGSAPSSAISAIQSAGLVASLSGTVATSNSGIAGTVASQSPSANSLVEYETTVSYQTYVYEEPPCTGTGTIWWGYCEGGSLVSGSFTWYYCTTSFEAALEAEWPAATRPAGFTATNSGPIPSDYCGPASCLNTYSFTYYDGGCNYAIYDCNGGYVGSTRVTTCSSPGTDSSGATIPGCSQNCSAPPTLYYASGCCGSSPVTASSYASASQAIDYLEEGCQVGVTNVSTSTSGYPSVSCDSPAPTPTYTFVYDLGTPTCSGSTDASGSVYAAAPGNKTVSAGNCGSQTFYAFTSGTFYWKCCAS